MPRQLMLSRPHSSSAARVSPASTAARIRVSSLSLLRKDNRVQSSSVIVQAFAWSWYETRGPVGFARPASLAGDLANAHRLALLLRRLREIAASRVEPRWP